ncbi:dehydrogenase [Nocardioides flavus (ex Wang et al. 2016)]|uniref:Dehydrogenase n=1 Tax=Nocardioides flavus (ex Wang et al. 2016) TaxID=2058780 RepID=A0ABQ3HHP8_9ACTN|nr:FAD binding domain-containing protein [Nocardioides flavus (ex Wang et al. 2016)]GHE17081.1 dehydrogenase [Nocardioides flavus (ex Wang et al. 2016)]
MPDPQVTVNGLPRPLAGVPAHTNALDFVRGLGLTGAKEGCAEGECGACAVLVARPDGDGSRWAPVNACLVPALALDGQEVVTAEGLGSPEALHPVQSGLAEVGGSQCGYCTPGFVCSLAAEYYRPDRVPGPDGFDVHAIGGNLCRCTGYRPIRDAGRALGAPATDDPLLARQDRPAPPPVATRAEGFARPADLADALALLAEHPEATVVAGSTDWGVEANLRGRRAAYVVAVDRVPELREVTRGDRGIEIGSALTLSEVEAALGDEVPLLAQVWPQFASRLIRNGATIGGNLATASPIGDLAPALLALEARLVLASADGEREVGLADFFTGYRETVLRPAELIRAIRVPTPLSARTTFRKIAKRRFDDISSVAVAVALDVTDGTVVRARIGLGGVAATPLRAIATEAALEGRSWDADTVEAASAVLAGEGTPIDDQRASAAYRSAMLGNALRAWWAEDWAGESAGEGSP